MHVVWCTTIIAHACTMIIVHPSTIIIVHVPSPTRLMFGTNDRGSRGRSPPGKQGGLWAARPSNVWRSQFWIPREAKRSKGQSTQFFITSSYNNHFLVARVTRCHNTWRSSSSHQEVECVQSWRATPYENWLAHTTRKASIGLASFTRLFRLWKSASLWHGKDFQVTWLAPLAERHDWWHGFKRIQEYIKPQ